MGKTETICTRKQQHVNENNFRHFPLYLRNSDISPAPAIVETNFASSDETVLAAKIGQISSLALQLLSQKP